ncbi:elongator complex protein 5 [Macadamia integrifolia]|uniref:elongator complex protein 5 n=1 Tax=Macadamia integrifolia TaxID=60698 RepID=UPI001C4F586F|nr:elongator complex protein 5 [Macadamia integrifolia]
MAESICRALRDGALEGEHAPALTIKDSILSSFGIDIFNFVLSSIASKILAGKSQARGLVLVAFSRSPSYYIDLLRSRGIDVTSSNKWLWIIDCYSDPLGWKERLLGSERVAKVSGIAAETLCKDVRDLDKLFSTILEHGKGLVGHGKVRFSVAIDLVSTMLRHALLPCVAGLISNLRSHDQVSSIFWLIHSDLHEARVTTVLEYMSSMVANLEPIVQSSDGQRGNSDCLLQLEQNSRKGKLHARFKRRNGRVKVMYEEFYAEQAGIKFVTAVSSGNGMVDHNLLPKVQFNLQLSEKERIDRAKVVLPFEHQGNGKPVQIYDGRQSLPEGQNDVVMLTSTNKNAQKEPVSGMGEIHYVRDSDDEMPDSDEDPDDDLDI